MGASPFAARSRCTPGTAVSCRSPTPCRSLVRGRGPLCRQTAGTRQRGLCIQGTARRGLPAPPRLMGIHAGSRPSPWHPGCRQELPALFPAFAAKRLPAPCECPVPAPAGTSPAPMALGGASQWSRGGVCPPCSTGATGHGRCGSGTGLGVVLGAPTLLQEVGTFVEAFAGAARASGVGSVCTPLLAPVVLWGGEPGLGPPAGTTDPTNGGSLARMGTAAPYSPTRAPREGGGGLPRRAAAPLPHSLVLPGQELLGTALSPQGCRRTLHAVGGSAWAPPSWGHHWGDAVTFSMWQCRSHAGGY